MTTVESRRQHAQVIRKYSKNASSPLCLHRHVGGITDDTFKGSFMGENHWIAIKKEKKIIGIYSIVIKRHKTNVWY